jgi:hypothetical protein
MIKTTVYMKLYSENNLKNIISMKKNIEMPSIPTCGTELVIYNRSTSLCIERVVYNPDKNELFLKLRNNIVKNVEALILESDMCEATGWELCLFMPMQ